MFNMFSGGALEQLSIFALGIMPYVSASIILQLLTRGRAAARGAAQRGRAGQRKINQYTRYGTIVRRRRAEHGHRACTSRASTAPTPVRRRRARAGLGLPPDDDDLADHRHRVHHVARRADHRARHRQRHLADHLRRHRARTCPTRCSAPASQLEDRRDLQPIEPAARGWPSCSRIVAVICFFERAQRRIPIQYAKRMVGRKMYGGQTSHLPLKVNMRRRDPADLRVVDPDVPAARCANLNVPGMEQLSASVLQPGDWRYTPIFVVLIVFFCVLLHGGHVPAGRGRGQPEEAERVHPRHSSGQEHRRLHRPRADAHHGRRRALRGGRLHDPVAPADVLPRAVLLRRHVHHDRRRRRARHRAADRVAPDHAPLRRAHRSEGSAHPSAKGVAGGSRTVRTARCGQGHAGQAPGRACSKIPQISTGDMMRAERAAGSDLGQAVRQLHVPGPARPGRAGARADRAAPRPARRSNGAIFDGYPRTVAQAEAFDTHARQARAARSTRWSRIEVPLDEMIERAVGRRICEATGRIYHLRYDPPPARSGGGAWCSVRTTPKRSFASATTSTRTRRAPCSATTEARARGRAVNGVGTLDEVTARIKAALGI